MPLDTPEDRMRRPVLELTGLQNKRKSDPTNDLEEAMTKIAWLCDNFSYSSYEQAQQIGREVIIHLKELSASSEKATPEGVAKLMADLVDANVLIEVLSEGLKAAPSAIEPPTITHVICFEGEGAEVIACTSWKDCTDKFFAALCGNDPEGVPLDERTSWLDAFADDDNWNHDEDRRQHCFTSDIGEISKVRIYQVNPVPRSDGSAA